MTYDKEAMRLKDIKLNALIRDLKKNTPYSKLLELDKKYPGLMVRFWRKNSANPNFVDWMNSLDAKEEKSKPKIKKEVFKEEEYVETKVEVQEVNFEVKETEMERVMRALEEIKLKYGGEND